MHLHTHPTVYLTYRVLDCRTPKHAWGEHAYSSQKATTSATNLLTTVLNCTEETLILNQNGGQEMCVLLQCAAQTKGPYVIYCQPNYLQWVKAVVSLL